MLYTTTSLEWKHVTFIYFFKEKKTYNIIFWFVFNASFQICKMLFHWDLINIHLLVFLESIRTKIFRRKPTIREFKIECNRILLFCLIDFFFGTPLCPLQVHFQVFLLVFGGHNSVSLVDQCYKSLDVLRYRIFRRGKWFIPLKTKNKKLGLIQTCL